MLDYRQTILEEYGKRAWKIAELVFPGSSVNIAPDTPEPFVLFYILLENLGFSVDYATAIARRTNNIIQLAVNESKSAASVNPYIIQILDNRFLIKPSSSELIDLETLQTITVLPHMPMLSFGISLTSFFKSILI
jgi:hypothetical protein